ncbi:MAG: mandelate racemase family protein [Inquilinaceae bacterium]
MTLADVSVRVFRHTTRTMSDTDGHAHPGPERETRTALLTLRDTDGDEGHFLCSPEVVRPYLLEKYLKPELIGRDPFDRERIWQRLFEFQRGSAGLLPDRTLAAVECALWDLAGRKLGQPVWKLLGGYRDRVPAYGSTMCGDEMEGGLATPEDYGRFTEWLIGRGYTAIKLHTWMPPVSWAPDPRMDLKACAAVREAAGPDFPLMLDANHWYSREDALFLGRGLQDLGFYWYEEPMDEYSTSSYAWLADQLDIPIIGPETAHGKLQTRAEWGARGASDILRTGVQDIGGITPALKVAHLAEAFGMSCEVHGGGAANLSLLGAMRNGRWYERGLLHPFLDYDACPAYLNSIPDPMDQDGYVPMPMVPGLGQDIAFDYIADNEVPAV